MTRDFKTNQKVEDDDIVESEQKIKEDHVVSWQTVPIYFENILVRKHQRLTICVVYCNIP